MYTEDEECDHNWVENGTGTMIDPKTGEERTVQYYICTKCGTSSSSWA